MLYIANEIDRPCARLICEAAEYNDGIYLATNERCYLDPERKTRLDDFSVILGPTQKLGEVIAHQIRPTSEAKYKDGTPRLWQPENSPEKIFLDDYLTPWKLIYLIAWFRYRANMGGIPPIANVEDLVREKAIGRTSLVDVANAVTKFDAGLSVRVYFPGSCTV